MSVESEALERSKLEQKDRAELATIVDAMGGKATSRAKKADLVDQILALAGVPTDAPAAPVADAPNGRGRGAAPATEADPEPVAPSTTAPSDPAEEPSAEWELAVTDAGDDAKAEGAGAERGDAQPQGDKQDGDKQDGDKQDGDKPTGGDKQDGDKQDGDKPTGGDKQDGDKPTGGDKSTGGGKSAEGGDGRQGGDERQGGDQRQQGQQGQRQQGQQGQPGGGPQGEGGDAEPGNRRRRRRGRDRGRDRGEQPAEEFQVEPVDVEGYLDLRDEGYGFLRVKGYLPSKEDSYVSVKQVRQFGLRRGDYLKGASRPASRNEKNPALLRIDEVNGKDPEQARQRRRFEDLTPLFPDEKLKMELTDDPSNMTARIIDLISPIGKGQRGLVVSPPKAGKTFVMKSIARSIEINDPEVHLIVLLVDERPEEVTDFRRWLIRGEVAASTFDRPADEHTAVAELTIERAKRMVEEGRDVVIMLDGITRLARAYNLAAPATGRIMSGGVDSGALYPPKKFFGAARNIEEGGSLTILATALVETGSRMDEVIFEEFKGTGNMELKLDRRLAERRIYPAIDVDSSSTRHEELLFQRSQLNLVWKLRRVLSGLAADNGNAGPGLELLLDRMKTFKTNDEFLAEIAKAPMGV
ncbi:MAG: transcription termination factor Rho [Acidimicrobiales bacterium]